MIVGLLLVVWAIAVAHIALRLPLQLDTTGDSIAYLDIASFRPPLYGWFLNVWEYLTGGLYFLPQVQFLAIAIGLLVFAGGFAGLVRNAIAGAVLVPLVLMHPSIHDAPRWMMTEAVYVGEILAGLGLQFRYARTGAPACLLAAAFCFALSTLTRSTGAVFLLLPAFTAVFDRRLRPAAAALRSAAACAAMAAVLLAGMAGNYARHGRFEIGSWAGLSLLQKSLLLVQPADLPGMPPPVAAVAPVAAAERGLVARQPDEAATLRAHVQVTSSDLRWGVFIPDAEQTWPAWRDADWRKRGELGGIISRKLIARHFAGYLRLWANDWLSLVVQPAYWPAWATRQATDGDDFAACRLQQNCWALERYDMPLIGVLVLLILSIGGPLAALGILAANALPVLRRRANPGRVLFFAVAGVLHAGMLVSAAFEAGHVRMTVAFHVMDAAILAWLTVCALGRIGAWLARALPRDGMGWRTTS